MSSEPEKQPAKKALGEQRAKRMLEAGQRREREQIARIGMLAAGRGGNEK